MERIMPAVFVYFTLSFNERGISYWRALWCGWTSIKQCFSLRSEEQSIIVFKVKPASSSPVSLLHTWGVWREVILLDEMIYNVLCVCLHMSPDWSVPSGWLPLHLALCVTVEMETSVQQSQWRCCAQAPVTWQHILILSSQKRGGEVCAGGK